MDPRPDLQAIASEARVNAEEVFGPDSEYVHSLAGLLFENTPPDRRGARFPLSHHALASNLRQLQDLLAAMTRDLEQFDSLWARLHPSVHLSSRRRLNDGHHADAVEAGFKDVSRRVRVVYKGAGKEDIDGWNLMMNAIVPGIVQLGDPNTMEGKDMQRGYQHLFAGAYSAVRNPKAHGDVRIGLDRAFHFLFLLSLMHHKLDEGGVPP